MNSLLFFWKKTGNLEREVGSPSGATTSPGLSQSAFLGVSFST